MRRTRNHRSVHGHLLALAAVVMLGGGARSHAATPESACQSGRYAAASKYGACEQKALAKYKANEDISKLGQAVSRCRVKYWSAWTKLQAKAMGTGSTCDAPRFAVNGPIVRDHLTDLDWERKTDDGSIHDKDDTYRWCVPDLPLTPFSCANGAIADGTAFTSFLATLNAPPCLGGHCDWRLPTPRELETILSSAYPCSTSPCIDETIFGPTATYLYWSSLTDLRPNIPLAAPEVGAWAVFFSTGDLTQSAKHSALHVRAVRGGL